MSLMREAFHADDLMAMAADAREALEECRKSKDRDLTAGSQVTHGDVGPGDAASMGSPLVTVDAIPIRCIIESIVIGTKGSKTILTGSTHTTGSGIGTIIRVLTRKGPGCPGWDGIWHEVR